MNRPRILFLTALAALTACDDNTIPTELAQCRADKQRLDAENTGLRADNARLKATQSAKSAEPPAEKESDCTLEVAKKNSPAKEAEFEKAKVDDQKLFDDMVAGLKELPTRAAKLPAPPAGTPRLPYGALELTTSFPTTLKPTFYSYNHPSCILGWNSEESKYEQMVSDWRQVAALALDGWDEFADEHLAEAVDGKKGERNYSFNLFFVSHLFTYAKDHDTNKALVNGAISAINGDGAVNRQIAQWAIALAKAKMEAKNRPLAEALIADLYDASATDFVAFHKTVTGSDVVKPPTEEAPEGAQAKDYDFDKKGEHLKGLFLRRWMEHGGGDAGNAMVLRLRYWLVEAGASFALPQAKTWAAETRKAFASKVAGLNAAPYLTRLATLAK